jgi:hypothetical protein
MCAQAEILAWQPHKRRKSVEVFCLRLLTYLDVQQATFLAGFLLPVKGASHLGAFACLERLSWIRTRLPPPAQEAKSDGQRVNKPSETGAEKRDSMREPPPAKLQQIPSLRVSRGAKGEASFHSSLLILHFDPLFYRSICCSPPCFFRQMLSIYLPTPSIPTPVNVPGVARPIVKEEHKRSIVDTVYDLQWN